MVAHDDERHGNTQRLRALTLGDSEPKTIQALFVACQRELRSAAGKLMGEERPGHTLQPTALVNEAYLRLFDVESLPIESRTHFVNIAARVMRQVLVQHARRRRSQKRGSGQASITLSNAEAAAVSQAVDLFELDDALRKLAELDARAAEIVELRIFGGMTMEELSALMGISRRTAQAEWRFAVLWLRDEFTETEAPGV